MKVAHLTTVDMSLRFLVLSQLQSVLSLGGEAVGISAPGGFVEELEDVGVRHLPLPSSTRGIAPLADLAAAMQLWHILRRERPDVLHTHNPKPGLYGRVLGRITGIPIVVNTVHGLYATDDDGAARRALVYALEAIAARFSDAELVQSREDLGLMDRLRLAPRGKAVWLGNGIDMGRFDPGAPGPSRREIRRSMDLGEGEIVVGMVGRLVREKGYPEFFEAVKQLGEGYVGVVVGPIDPDKPDSLDPAMVESARAEGVRFLGMRRDVELIYRAMDIFVLPSHREGFPRAAMEAAAMGLPIVATDIRGCREVVDDGVNGFLIPVRSPHDLMAAIHRLGEDETLRDTMGAEGRRKALAEFDEQRVVGTVLDAYRAIAVRKGLSGLAAELGPRSRPLMRAATVEDASALARLHIAAIRSGFLPRLGHRFLTVLYRALVQWDQGVVVVADPGGGPVGFVAGAADTSAFYRHFFRRRWLAAIWSAVPALLRPNHIRRAIETAGYGRHHSSTRAELLAMAVDEAWRGTGIGSSLGRSFLDSMKELEQRSVRVVVGCENTTAISAYRRMGFVETETLEIHPGEPSQVLVWSS